MKSKARSEESGDAAGTSGVHARMEPLPAAVAALIGATIRSVPELEAILLLRENAERDWGVAEVSQRLYIDRDTADSMLKDLVKRGLLTRSGELFRYGPATEDLRAAVDELTGLYVRHLVAVSELIHAKSRA